MSCYTKKADLIDGEKKRDGIKHATEFPLVALTIGGDIKKGFFDSVKKPNPRPMQLGLGRLGCKCNKILSVCTKVIDKEASEGAGIDIIVNPNPKEISRNKKNIFGVCYWSTRCLYSKHD